MELKDLLVDYRNSVKKDLSESELADIDVYIEKLINDTTPVSELIKSIANNSKKLKELKTAVDRDLSRLSWQEKN